MPPDERRHRPHPGFGLENPNNPARKEAPTTLENTIKTAIIIP
jgi:hypothetical protein